MISLQSTSSNEHGMMLNFDSQHAISLSCSERLLKTVRRHWLHYQRMPAQDAVLSPILPARKSLISNISDSLRAPASGQYTARSAQGAPSINACYWQEQMVGVDRCGHIMRLWAAGDAHTDWRCIRMLIQIGVASGRCVSPPQPGDMESEASRGLTHRTDH